MTAGAGDEGHAVPGVYAYRSERYGVSVHPAGLGRFTPSASRVVSGRRADRDEQNSEADLLAGSPTLGSALIDVWP